MDCPVAFVASFVDQALAIGMRVIIAALLAVKFEVTSGG